MSTINERIKKVRKENDLTQKAFAEKLSLSRPFINRVETGKEVPSDTILKLIALEFEISLEWLKTGEGFMEPEEDDELINVKENFLSLLKIEEFLETDDWEAYEHYNYMLRYFTELLTCNEMDVELEHNYLENMGNLFSDIHRLILAFRNMPVRQKQKLNNEKKMLNIINNHIDVINKDLFNILKLFSNEIT